MYLPALAARNFLDIRHQMAVPKRKPGSLSSITTSGIVDKIIPSFRPNRPEETLIAVDRANHPHRDFRIENTLTDEHGDDVKLKKGAHVEVTVTAEPKTVNRRNP